MKLLPIVFVLALFGSQQSDGPSNDEASIRQKAQLQYERHRRAAIEINELAGRIHSEGDAAVLVDKLADLLSDTLPPPWLTSSIRQRISHAEYEAASNSLRLIPEQRIIDVWNEYVREIGASDEALVTVAEIRNLRDANFASGQLLWSRGNNQSIWTMPNVYAVGPDGKVADGCRAVEALRVFYDLDMMFGNLRGARERVRKGILVSDEIRKRLESPAPKARTVGRLGLVVQSDTSPIFPAEVRYLEQHGPYVLMGVVEKLFDELFPQTD